MNGSSRVHITSPRDRTFTCHASIKWLLITLCYQQQIISCEFIYLLTFWWDDKITSVWNPSTYRPLVWVIWPLMNCTSFAPESGLWLWWHHISPALCLVPPGWPSWTGNFPSAAGTVVWQMKQYKQLTGYYHHHVHKEIHSLKAPKDLDSCSVA